MVQLIVDEVTGKILGFNTIIPSNTKDLVLIEDEALEKIQNEYNFQKLYYEDGKIIEKEFPIENIVSDVKIPDYTLSTITNLNGNMTFLLASSFIGKDVQVIPQDENGKDLDPVKGLVKGTYKENGTIMVTVELESGETKSYSYDRITKVGQN